VVQGERELVSDCRSLAQFTLHGVPPMAAGAARIRVTFQVDADGLLSVTAREQTSGVESSIQVKPSYGLSDNEITAMIKDSMAHARDDMDARNLREQQVEADRVLEALQIALAADGATLLNESERAAIELAVAEVRRCHQGNNWMQLKEAVTKLNRASTEFAARRMNLSIQRALSGQSLQQLG
jgi:molecular chaperone HscA